MHSELFHLYPSGDAALVVQFGTVISAEVHNAIRSFVHAIEQKSLTGIQEIIPGYIDINIAYDPKIYFYEDLYDILHELKTSVLESTAPKANCIQIPVCYGGNYGPDIQAVATHCDLSVEELIHLHTAPDYLVHMLGFMPGFPYLGGMDTRLAVPRLKTPRLKIPAGSVGIAGEQTGIYPSESPGGWQLIGRSPAKLFDMNRQPEFLIHAGDFVQFYAIDEATFTKISGGQDAS